MTKLEFKAEVKKQMVLREWNYKDLAAATGYTHQTIQVMMCDDAKLTDCAMDRISEVLNIKAR